MQEVFNRTNLCWTKPMCTLCASQGHLIPLRFQTLKVLTVLLLCLNAYTAASSLNFVICPQRTPAHFGGCIFQRYHYKSIALFTLEICWDCNKLSHVCELTSQQHLHIPKHIVKTRNGVVQYINNVCTALEGWHTGWSPVCMRDHQAPSSSVLCSSLASP